MKNADRQAHLDVQWRRLGVKQCQMISLLVRASTEYWMTLHNSPPPALLYRDCWVGIYFNGAYCLLQYISQGSTFATKLCSDEILPSSGTQSNFPLPIWTSLLITIVHFITEMQFLNSDGYSFSNTSKHSHELFKEQWWCGFFSCMIICTDFCLRALCSDGCTCKFVLVCFCALRSRSMCPSTIPLPVRPGWPRSWQRRSKCALPRESASSSIYPKECSTPAVTALRRRYGSEDHISFLQTDLVMFMNI